MDQNSKPFACPIKGCTMTFTNEDHLNWHHKKHDMVLNLGLANKNAEVGDQTPTPTRFIRNCEEVGLFQDLQNVNPFDETFKKAVESAKSGHSLQVLQPITNDDTLHTPHILPHVEDKPEKYDGDHTYHSTDFCITPVTEPTCEMPKDVNDKSASLKDKLKQSIISKGKISALPMGKLKIVKPKLIKKERSREIHPDNDEKEKIREINRAAQLRCRKRKRLKLQQMEDDLKELKSENVKLKEENYCLKHKLSLFREFILDERKTTDNGNNLLLKKIEEILQSNPPAKKTNSTLVEELKNPSTPPHFLVPVLQVPNEKPLVIQLMGSQVSLAVLPSE